MSLTTGRPPARGWRRFAGDRRGVAAIEFAMLAIPFFLLIFALIETALIFLGEFTLDQAATRVARLVRTGEAQKAALSADDFRKAICTEVSYLLKCADIAIDLKVYQSFADLPPPPAVQNGSLNTAGFGYQLGGTQAVQALRIYYKWPVLTDMMRSTLSDMSDGSHLLSSIVVFQTEPY